MSSSPKPSSAPRGAGLLVLLLALTTAPLAAGDETGAPAGTGTNSAAIRVLQPIPVQSVVPLPPMGEPLDLDACVRIALSESPSLRAATEGVAAAVASEGVARAAYYPEVSLDGRYRRFDSHVFLPSGLPVEDTTLGATDDWSGGLRLGYAVFDSGVRRAEASAAAAGVEASGQDAERVRQDVVFAVHRAYYRTLSAQAQMAAAVAREERARDHLRLAEVLNEAGAVPYADVLRARVEHAEARLAIVRSESAMTVARGELATAMGLPASTSIEVQDRPPVPGDEVPEDPQTALAKALSRRPELAAARERIQAAGHRTSAIKGSYGPRVNAEVALGLRDSELLPEDQEWSVGVAVKVPLFDGHAKQHRIERASLETKILEAEAEALANQIEQEVWAASSELASAAESVRQRDEIRTEARESLAFSRARYEAGAGTINDLLDAESTVTQAESSYVGAVLGYRLATSRLLRVQGEL